MPKLTTKGFVSFVHFKLGADRKLKVPKGADKG